MASKKFAILLDIHGNLEALKTALSVVQSHNDIDQIIFLGDYFSLGPAPKEVLQLLKSIKNPVFMRGNHERYIIEKLWTQTKPTLEGMSPDDPVVQQIVKHQEWTADQIGTDGLDFISQCTKISHKEIFDSTLVEFTHAWQERDEITPSLDEAKVWREHAKKVNPEINNFILVHGHIHLLRNEHHEDLKILCPISTGLPFDKITKGAIGFLTIGDKFEWEVHRFEYDLNVTIKLLDKRQPPFYKNLQDTIRFAEIRNASK